MVNKPQPSVEKESLAVKDDANLYPSSILHRNMSHETFGVDESIETWNDIIYSTSAYSPHFLHQIWTSWRCLKYQELWKIYPWGVCHLGQSHQNFASLWHLYLDARWIFTHGMFRDEKDARMKSLLEILEVIANQNARGFGVFLQFFETHPKRCWLQLFSP